MNALLSNIPFDALGQPAATLVDTDAGSDTNGFAEALAAAMGTAAIPSPDGSPRPAGAADGRQIEGPAHADAPGTAAGIWSHVGLEGRAEGQTLRPASDATLAGRGNRQFPSAGVVNDVASSGLDENASINIDRPAPGPSVLSQPQTRHPSELRQAGGPAAPVADDQIIGQRLANDPATGLASASTGTGRAEGRLALPPSAGRPLIEAGAKQQSDADLAIIASSTLAEGASKTVTASLESNSGGHRATMAASAFASETAAAALQSSAESYRATMAAPAFTSDTATAALRSSLDGNRSSTETSTAADLAARMARSTLSVAAGGPSVRAVSPSHLDSAATAATPMGRSVVAGADAPAVSPVDLDDAQSPLRAAVMPSQPAATNAQSDIARLLAARPENGMPAPRRPGVHPLVEAAANVVTAQVPGGNAGQSASENGSVTSSSVGRSVDGSLISANNPNSKSLQAGASAGVAVQSAAADLGAQDPIDSFDRLREFLPAEAGLRDGDRFEPALGMNATRVSASAAPAAAGAQVALQIVRSAASGADHFSMHLEPADLGSVDIQLTFETTGKLTAHIVAERPETLELLQRDSRLLERSLGDSGLKLTHEGLSFTLKQDQQHQQGQGFQHQADAWRERSEASRSYDNALDAEAIAPPVRVEKLRLLDIRT